MRFVVSRYAVGGSSVATSLEQRTKLNVPFEKV